MCPENRCDYSTEEGFPELIRWMRKSPLLTPKPREKWGTQSRDEGRQEQIPGRNGRGFFARFVPSWEILEEIFLQVGRRH